MTPSMLLAAPHGIQMAGQSPPISRFCSAKRLCAALAAETIHIDLLFQLAGGQLRQIRVQEPIQVPVHDAVDVAGAPHAPPAPGDPAWDSNGRAEPAHFKVLLRKTLGRRTCGVDQPHRLTFSARP